MGGFICTTAKGTQTGGVWRIITSQIRIRAEYLNQIKEALLYTHFKILSWYSWGTNWSTQEWTPLSPYSTPQTGLYMIDSMWRSATIYQTEWSAVGSPNEQYWPCSTSRFKPRTSDIIHLSVICHHWSHHRWRQQIVQRTNPALCGVVPGESSPDRFLPIAVRQPALLSVSLACFEHSLTRS